MEKHTVQGQRVEMKGKAGGSDRQRGDQANGTPAECVRAHGAMPFSEPKRGLSIQLAAPGSESKKGSPDTRSPVSA